MKCERYAIWWVPRPATALARFGVEWTGWCADLGTAHARRALAALPGAALSGPRAGVPGAGRLRGLHATIAAPFRPAAGRSAWALEDALAELAARFRPIRLPRLRVEVREGRVVLAPVRPDEAVTRLLTAAAEAVRPFRVAPDFAALSGPRSGSCAVAAGGMVLSDTPPDTSADMVGEAGCARRMLARFRMPLTDRIDAATAAEIAAGLEPALAPVLARQHVLGDLALVGDPGRGRPWRLLERFGLEAEAPAPAAPQPAGMDTRGPDLLAPFLAPSRRVAA